MICRTPAPVTSTSLKTPLNRDTLEGAGRDCDSDNARIQKCSLSLYIQGFRTRARGACPDQQGLLEANRTIWGL